MASVWDTLVLLIDFQTMGFGPEAVRLGQPTGSVPAGKAARHHARAPEEQMRRGSGMPGPGLAQGLTSARGVLALSGRIALGSWARAFPDAEQQLQSGFSFSGKKKIDFFIHIG